jgi:hypothetical protein
MLDSGDRLPTVHKIATVFVAKSHRNTCRRPYSCGLIDARVEVPRSRHSVSVKQLSCDLSNLNRLANSESGHISILVRIAN